MIYIHINQACVWFSYTPRMCNPYKQATNACNAQFWGKTAPRVHATSYDTNSPSDGHTCSNCNSKCDNKQ